MKELRIPLCKTAVVVLIGAGSIFVTGCAAVGSAGNAGLGQDSVDSQFEQDSQHRYGIKRHIYAGVGVGRSRMEPDTSEVPGADVNDRVEAGGQIALGVDVTRHLSLEAHTADLGSAGISPTGRINYHTYGVSALMYAGKNRGNFKRQGLSGYGRLGYGLLENSPVGDVDFVKDNGSHFLIGAGLEYMTRMGLGIRAEAISFEEDARYMQLGLVYRTGKRSSEKPVEIVKVPEPKVEPVKPTPAPIPVPAVVVAEPVIPEDTCEEFKGTLEGVNFHTNSAKLTEDAKGVLDSVAQRLGECGSSPVQISAHTDSVGDDNYNQALSARRADSVAQYLSEQGIDGERLRTEAFGETQPIDSNATREGRRKNRRVELTTVQ